MAMTSTHSAPAFPNIGPRGCQRRKGMSWVWFAIAAAMIAVLAWRDAPPLWYAVTAIPFLFAALGVFQAREQTCVFLAGVGQRDLDAGAEAVTDPEVLSVMRRQALIVWGRSLLAMIGLTGFTVLIALARG
jgi:hypothetical protein